MPGRQRDNVLPGQPPPVLQKGARSRGFVAQVGGPPGHCHWRREAVVENNLWESQAAPVKAPAYGRFFNIFEQLLIVLNMF